MGIAAKVDMSGVEAQVEAMKSRIREAVRPAAFNGAQMMYREAVARAPMSKEAHVFKGRNGQEYVFYPGDLRRSIYMAYSDDASVDGQRATYHVSYRKNQRSRNGFSVPYAHWMEFGNSRVAARSFLRSAETALRQQVRSMIIQSIKDAAGGNT